MADDAAITIGLARSNGFVFLHIASPFSPQAPLISDTTSRPLPTGNGAPAARSAPRLLFPERNSAKFGVIRCESIAFGENAFSGFSGFQVQKPQ